MRRLRMLLWLGTVASGSALLVGCQNEYPLEPTPCDHWCAATERAACGGLDPAECVVACEAQNRPECDGELMDASKCIAALSDEDACEGEGFFAPNGYCSVELALFAACRSQHQDGAE